MEIRQRRQTWVKETIGLGSVSEMKVMQDVRTSGGKRFTGRSEFLQEIISHRTSLAWFSRASTCEAYRQHPRFPSNFPRPYFSGQGGHQNGRGGQRHRRPHPYAFREKFPAQRADELFDGEFESDVGYNHAHCLRSVVRSGDQLRVLKWNPCAGLQNQEPEIWMGLWGTHSQGSGMRPTTDGREQGNNPFQGGMTVAERRP